MGLEEKEKKSESKYYLKIICVLAATSAHTIIKSAANLAQPENKLT
jgi:hypothetical protein